MYLKNKKLNKLTYNKINNNIIILIDQYDLLII